MTESLMVWLILASVFGWLAGGRGWLPFKKGWRRLIWPLVAGVLLWKTHVSVLTTIGVVGSLIVANSLGYGDSTAWWVRPLVFASYVLPSACLSLHLLGVLVLVSVIFLTVWWMISHRFNAWTQVTWESLAALMQASSLIIGRLAA